MPHHKGHHKDGHKHHKDGHHHSHHSDHGHHGMRSPTMPKEHWEKHAGDLDVANTKYAGKDSMSNPEELSMANHHLAEYAKRHKMKY